MRHSITRFANRWLSITSRVLTSRVLTSRVLTSRVLLHL